MSASTTSELKASLSKLSLSSQNSTSTKKAQKTRNPVADSWEDESLSSGDETDRPLTLQPSADYPSAPPPTPISPTSPNSSRDAERYISPYGPNGRTDGSTSPVRERERNTARPEKTDAVAKRLIAGALGVRAPKKTEEQRAYDRAVKEKEMKRREREKEAARVAEEDAEKAKKATWDD